MMQHSNADGFLEAARRAIQAGQTAAAQRYLKQALQRDPQNVMAWLWLAGVSPSPQKAKQYIDYAEKLQPTHPAIPKAKQWLQKQNGAVLSPQTGRAKRPFPHQWTALAIRSSLIVLILLLLVGTGWFVWQQLNPSPDQPNNQTAFALLQEEQANPTGQPTNTSQAISETAVSTPTPAPIQLAAKTGQQRPELRATWTVTPLPSPTPLPTPTAQPTFTSPDYTSDARPFGVGAYERWIDVNLTTQSLTAYEGDTAVFTALVSSGTWDYPTVTGQFRIWLRFESQTMNGRLLGYDYFLEDVPYVMYFFEDYAIHGAYWHTNFGTPMSHGCVNVAPTDAGWLYDWASLGTLVNVHY